MEGVSKQNLITANAINCRTILVLFGLNRTVTKGTKGLTSWSTKTFLQNLRYRRKVRQNTEGKVKESKLINK